MKKKIPDPLALRSFAVCVLCAFTAVLLFSGCNLYGTVGGDDTNIEGALPYLLQGEWAFVPASSGRPGDGYIITPATIEYGYSENASPMDFKGNIEFVSNYSSDSGLIIIEYTERPAYPEYNGKDYFAIYYRNLKSGSVQLANTTVLPVPASTSSDTATLEEAKKKFTRMTTGKYVDWGAVMPQTRIK